MRYVNRSPSSEFSVTSESPIESTAGKLASRLRLPFEMQPIGSGLPPL